MDLEQKSIERINMCDKDCIYCSKKYKVEER